MKGGKAGSKIKKLNKEAQDILCRNNINPFIGCENLAFSRNWGHSEVYAQTVKDELEEEETKGRGKIIAKLKELSYRHNEGKFGKTKKAKPKTDE